MDDFLEKHIATLVTALVGALAWANEKRKKIAEVKQVESDANSSMQRVYATFVVDMRRNYEEMKLEITVLQLDVERLHKEIVEWKQKYNKLKEELQIFEGGVNTTSNITGTKREPKK